ncbi:MAG: cryptochrome/photolyase family protein [Spirosomataceae bacterium]
MTTTTLRLVLGDQLNHHHSWYHQHRPDVLYVLMEMRQETDYVIHHIQKVIGFFAAMRVFAEHLEQQGHRVLYLELNHPENTHSLTQNLKNLLVRYQCQQLEYQLPDEWRVDKQLLDFQQELKVLGVAVQTTDSEHFLSQRQELAQFFKGKKTFLMESFYRMMRKKYDILMEGDTPLTGRWNYDAENRKKLPAGHRTVTPLRFDKDVSELYEMVRAQGVQTIGSLNPKAFLWPITRAESLELLRFFVDECLPYFGTYQDAMSPSDWSLYHSRLSFSLNIKLLSPLEVVQAIVAAWQAAPTRIGIAQVEGFVRQIIGWREYMRGVYWAKMPDYECLNHLNHTRALPQWFWTANTKMRCLQHAIQQSLDKAYAHHIQRLMLTGNFALLAGIHPDELDQWYLGIYIDALQWVEITNTRGMSQFADGGIVGTKPYVSSANYIDKMSHYCQGCHYDKAQKVGAKACPFNSLYWHFYHRHRALLQQNPRIGMMYQTWDKFSASAQQQILDQAAWHLKNIEQL